MISNWKNMVPGLRKQSMLSGRPSSISDMMEELWREPEVLFSAFPSLLRESAGYPSVDVSETEKEIVAKAELPGMDAKDVEITLRNNVLSIKGEKKFEDEEKRDNYHRIERSYGSFCRTINLPASVAEDNVTAKFDKGVLTITMAKIEKDMGKKIQIES